MNWKKYWEQTAGAFDETAFCQQVGRTFAGGRPVTRDQLERVVADVRVRLALSPEHCLLDLCCGNGLLTVCLAEDVGKIVGVDFAGAMISIARVHHSRRNLIYLEASATDLLSSEVVRYAPYDRVCLIESLHYFEPDGLAKILEALLALGTASLQIYLPGIPDRRRREYFYDTPRRRVAHARAVAGSHDVMGRWWEPEEIEALAHHHGLRFTCLEQDPILTTAHYRFDVLLGAQGEP